MKNPRYEMADLDISERLPLDRVMSPQASDPKLGDIKYDVDSSNANITVSAGVVDTTDGSRDITLKITPKTKKVGKNKSHWVLLVDRSRDFSGKNNLDNNINKFITDLRKKADTQGAEVYISIIEYSGTKNMNKVLLSKTNIKDLDDANAYQYTMGTLSDAGNSQYNLDETNVSVKDYLSKVGIDKRNNGTQDGAFNLKPIVDANLANLTSDNYDNKYIINFASFNANNAKRNFTTSPKFYQFESMWAFYEKGYKRVYTHVDQENTSLASNSTGNAYQTYLRNNSDINIFDLTNSYVLKNQGFKKARGFGPYVQKGILDGILNDKSNFESEGKEESLLKNASVNIVTKDSIKLDSYTIKKNGNIEENQTNPTGNSINKENFSLGVGENLEINYKISLKEDAINGNNYPIHKSMTYSPNKNSNSVNLDSNSLETKKESTTPKPKTYNVIVNPTTNGSVSANPNKNVSQGTIVNLTLTPNEGYKLKSLDIKKTNEDSIPFKESSKEMASVLSTRAANGNPVYRSFKMPASDVTVDAEFERISKGDVDLKTVFTYSNQENGEDNSDPAPSGNAGTIMLLEKDETATDPLNQWKQVSVKDAPYQGDLIFENLDSSKTYKLEYTREDGNDSKWGTETTSSIDVDFSNLKKIEGQNDQKIITIKNGNLMEIFNKDETGFRIPLRITKVNENKGALTGSQFKARKILNGDKSLYKEINGKIEKTGESKDYPIYHDEKFDGVSEATGEPGDNYFRELTPGIYELTEIKAPDGTYRIPKDENGDPMKWYFQVFVYEGRDPRGADYMGINFNFTHKFVETDDFNKENVNDAEKAKLIGTTIEGLGSSNTKFNKYIKVIPDDGRSNPARPDAPYQGINDAQVTNYKSKTSLSFFKKDLETNNNLKDAEFTLRKVKTQKVDEGGKKVEKPVLGSDNKPEYAEVKTTDDKGKPYTDEQLDELMVQPYDKDKKYALAESTENLGVEFTNIEEGTYILEETKPAEGYKPTDSFLTITFTESDKGAWKQVIKAYKKDSNGNYVEMENTNDFFTKDEKGNLTSISNKKKYINFKFQKIRAKKGANNEEIPVNTASFELTQVDENGKPVPGAKQWDVQSNFLSNEFNFKNLGVGRYKLQETKVIEEFEKPDPWYFWVKDDEKNQGKLKIEFEKPKGHPYNSIDFTPYENSDIRPDIDEDGNPKDLKVKNFSRIKFKFQKLSNLIDEDKKQIPLKDARFSLKKLRYSMEDKAKAYEYYENEADESKNGALKKYSHGDQVTEFYETGIRKKFTKGTNVYEFDKKGDLIKVNGQAATQQDKDDLTNRKVIPDSVSAATGKYYSTMRSQSDGGVTFDELGEGIYELTETKIPEGYQSSNKQFSWIFEVKKTPEGLEVKHNPEFEKDYYTKFGISDPSKYKTGYSDKTNVKKSDGNNFSYEITNTKTTTDLKWKKIKNYEKTKLINQRTQFWLFKVSDDPTNPKVAESGQSSFAPYQVESSDGNFKIEDLSKGIYTLVETVAPDGYKKMQRQIVIQIYEDANDNYKLKQKFYEMKREKDKTTGKDKNVLVETPQQFTNLLTQGVTSKEVIVDKTDGTFYVNNEAKPQFFYLSKGFMKNEKGKDVFTDITKGELKIKIYADPKDENNKDTKVYERTIKLSDAKSYKIDVDGIKTGVDYILEEVQSPDGYAKTKYKYRLQFSENSVSHEFVAILKAVLDENNKPLTNAQGNITETGKYLGNGQSINSGFPFQIVNKKTEIEFTKYGKDGNTETKLNGVEFYLEKQNPKDQKYYSLTENMEMILPEINDQGIQTWYYINHKTGIKETSNNFISQVSPENNRGIYKSDDKEGKFTITNLTDGYYRIMEPNAPKDKDGKPYMKVNGPVKTFRVVDGEVLIADKDDETGKISEVLVTDENKEKLGKIINEKPGKGEFEVKKYDDFGKPMEGVDFKLRKDDANETESKSGTTNKEGVIKFEGLPYGYYWLEEIHTKDGYIVDTKKKLVSLGGDKEWNVPNKNTDVSSKIKFAQSQKDLESTSGEKDVVHPNEEEAILARFKLEFTNSKEIKPGNYFTLKLSDNVDIDGIVKDKDGNGKSDVSNLNIVGPAGVLAKAEVAEDRRTITYTFTDYVGDYTPTEMDLFLQLYPNREKLVTDQELNLNANIGASTYNKSINIDYRTDKGYQDPNIDVSSYMLRLEPGGKTFTAIVYYNQWNRLLTDKGIEFILDKNVDKDSLEVTTYKRLNNKNQAIEGSHSSGYQEGDLPDSYGIDPSVDKLQLVGTNYTLEKRNFNNIFGIPGTQTLDTITLPYGYLNKGYAIDKNTTNNDPMDTTYVIEIKGKLADTNVKSLKTQVQYNHKINWYTSGYDNYGYWRNNLLVGRYYAGAFKTWSQFYTPGASGNASKEMQVINFRNRIDFVKIDGGVKGEVPNTIPDENGNTQESSIFANDTIGEALAGAEFKLKKDGSQDFIEDSKTTSDERGRFSWVGLAEGSYEVWETKAPDGYKLPKEKVAEFTVSENGQITLTTGYREVIANKKVSKIKIRKVDQDGNPIPGEDSEGAQLDTQAGFSLIGNNVTGWKNLSKYTDAKGEASFEDIPAGNFKLKEIQIPKGYSHSGKTWELTVAKDGRMAWTNSFDDTEDILKIATYKENGTATTNLDTKIVGIDKDKKIFRQYNIIKANKDDLKNNKITISSPDTSIKLNQDNTKIRLVALDKNSSLDNQTPTKDDAEYLVEYNNNSMDVSIKLPEEKKINGPVGSAPGEEDKKQKIYLLIVDLPYTENSKVGAKITYKGENVDKTVEENSITEGNDNHSLTAFKNENNDYYRPRLVNDLDFVIENIKKPDIYFKKVDAKDKTALKGAEFEIQRENQEGKYLPLDLDGNVIKDRNAQTKVWTSTSDKDGHFGFSDIPDGKYQIVETKAPDGYALVQNIVFKFVVENGKIKYIVDKQNNIPKNGLKFENEKEYGKVNSEDNRILITNKKAQYPSTGGPGVWIGFTILGLVLMFIAVLTYSKRKDKLVV